MDCDIMVRKHFLNAMHTPVALGGPPNAARGPRALPGASEQEQEQDKDGRETALGISADG